MMLVSLRLWLWRENQPRRWPPSSSSTSGRGPLCTHTHGGTIADKKLHVALYVYISTPGFTTCTDMPIVSLAFTTHTPRALHKRYVHRDTRRGPYLPFHRCRRALSDFCSSYSETRNRDFYLRPHIAENKDRKRFFIRTHFHIRKKYRRTCGAAGPCRHVCVWFREGENTPTPI